MNWTEGGLARHSRASKGRTVLLRQKEHFAKARAGLLNANVKISPPSISFMSHPAHPSSPARHPSKSNASASSSSKKRKRDKDPPHSSRYFQDDAGLELPTPADFQRDQAEEEALLQKRRKLLLKGDWTGTTLQKPIEMEFSKPRASHGGPWGQSKSRHTKSSKSRLRNLLSVKHGAVQSRANEERVKMARPLSPSQLRVRVGSRERLLGGSSNASPRSRTCRDGDSSPQVAQLSKSKHRERRRRRSDRNDTATSQDVRTSQSPELHQPVPHRPFLPSLLRSQSSDPDDAASTKARVGVLQPDVPPSQKEQNETWWAFVGGFEHGEGASQLHPSIDQDPVQREVSPGVSQLGVPSDYESIIEGPPDGVTAGQGSSPHSSILPDQLEVATRKETPSCNGPITLINGSNWSSMGSSPPQPKVNIGLKEIREETVLDMDYGVSETSGLVSQAALPPSSSPTSDEILAQFYNLTNLHDVHPRPDVEQGDAEHGDIEHVHVKHMVSASSHPPEQSIQFELPQEEPCIMTFQQPKKSQEANSTPSKTAADQDANDLWRKFVFGESDDDLEAAFLEASKETAKKLCPSDPSTSTGKDETSEDTGLYQESSRMPVGLNTAIGNELNFTSPHYASSSTKTTTAFFSEQATLGATSPDHFSEPGVTKLASRRDSPLHGTSVMDSISNKATYGSCSSDPLSELNPARTNTLTETDPVAHSSSSSKAVPSALQDEFMRRSDIWSTVTGDNDNASLVAQPPSTRGDSELDNFKFARPKPFTGRHIQIDEQRQIALSAPQVQAKGVSWRRQKRIGDGRARIRSLPNFSGDPIEEVEDSEKNVPAKDTLKPSLFGSLDTEDGF